MLAAAGEPVTAKRGVISAGAGSVPHAVAASAPVPQTVTPR